MQRKHILRLGLLLAALIVVGGILFFRPTLTVQSSFSWKGLLQGNLPQFGWSVCADLGIGTVPGVPGSVQRVRICHGDGWQIDAYCLEPAKPVPPLGVICSMVSATDFWCGDENQLMRLFQIQQTPPPAPTGTNTPLPSATATATVTALPSTTPSPNTPAPQPSPSPVTPQVQPTAFYRPSPGGPGNLGLILSTTATGAGLIALALAIARLRKNTQA